MKLQVSQKDIASNLVEGAFKIKPLFKLAATMARQSIIKQGQAIGVDWDKETKAIYTKMDALENFYSSVDSKLEYPEYYLKPFHAYDEGNLSWQAAVEVEVAALTVHAPIFTPSRDVLDINGDFILRDNFHKNMMSMLTDKKVKPIRRILDIGCSTGLSTMKLHSTFPNAEIIACDLSPYMLSVAKLRLSEDQFKSAQGKVQYIHAAGEKTPLPDNSIDLAAMCLVSHELPEDASRNVFIEAHRVLRSGGAFTFMDVDPESASFQKLASNPFAFQAFRSTEPWLQEYISMNLATTLQEVGFSSISVKSNSPRHRTIVAIKK
jgi:ubiquinone/menaquinone biosynthesis C-methylase UbiE